MTACFRVTWQSHDNDVIGNHEKHKNKFKCIKFNGRISVTNSLRSGDHLPIDGLQSMQSADVKKVIGCHYDDSGTTIGRHSAEFENFILQNNLNVGAPTITQFQTNSQTLKILADRKILLTFYNNFWRQMTKRN